MIRQIVAMAAVGTAVQATARIRLPLVRTMVAAADVQVPLAEVLLALRCWAALH